MSTQGGKGGKSGARTDRALTTYVQQELSAPAEAIGGYVEILIEEAQKGGHSEFRDDLEKIYVDRGRDAHF